MMAGGIPLRRTSDAVRRLIIVTLVGGWLVTGGSIAVRATARCVATAVCPPATTYATLTAAVNAASSGDVIFIGATTISEPEIVIGTSLTLQGSGIATTMIDGGSAHRVFTINSGVSVTMMNLTIQNGHVAGGASGGNIVNSGTLTLVSCGVTGGSTAGDGAGIYTNGTLTITNSTVSNNAALANAHTTHGGGVYDASGLVTVSGSTFNNNMATGAGGVGGAMYSGGTVNITNSTFAGNNARDSGGAIANINIVTLTNVTIAGNQAGTGGGIDGGASVANTLIATNTATTNPDVNGAFTSGGHNLIGNLGSATGFNTSPPLFDQFPVSAPGLGSLGDNGGPTQTIPLLAGSPAINWVPASGANCPATDQRGVVRPQPSGANCDIGAYEVGFSVSSVSPGSGSTTGGGTVTLSGAGFVGGTPSVTFGGVTASLTSANQTTIVVTAPAHSTGAVDIVVTIGSLQTTVTNGYTYSITTALPGAKPANNLPGTIGNLPSPRPSSLTAPQPPAPLPLRR